MIFRGLDAVEGVDPSVVGNVRAEICSGDTVLVREHGGEVQGELCWLSGGRYDDAISLVDAWFGDNSERTKCLAFDERAGCEVDCWAYLYPIR